MNASRIVIATLAVLGVALQSPAFGQVAPEFSSERVLVRFKPGNDAQAAERAMARAGVRVGKTMSASRVSLLEITDKHKTVKQVLTALIESGQVEYAEPDYRVELDRFPDDPYFSQLWGLHNTGASGGTDDADIDAPEAWDRDTGDPGLVVAVIDTGVDYTHPDLAANIWVNPGEVANGLDDDGNGYVDDLHGINAITSSGDPWDDHYHGTHVAGTIGGVADNGIGVAGVAWNVQIMGCKFLDAGGSGYTSDAIQCLEYVTRMRTDYGVDVRITNNSWGGGGYSQALADAIQAAGDAGILFVAAAGNNGADSDAMPQYPAAYDLDAVVSVAATDRNDALASFSNYGATSVDLAAPGVAVLSSLPGGSYGSLSGTSMATPHVAGAAALLWGSHPAAGPIEIKRVLLASSDSIPALSGRVLTGGRLNVASAFGACESGVPMVETHPRSGFSTEVGVPLLVEVSAADCGTVIAGVTVAITPEGASTAIDARDDGVDPDRVADDGVYTATWTPDRVGAASLLIEVGLPGTTVTVNLDGTVLDMPNYVASMDEPFDWVDASAGTYAGFFPDDGGVTIPLGFEFPFFGALHGQVAISSNGYLTFGTSASTYVNGPIPGGGEPNDLIAPYWDDLNPSSAGEIYYLLDGVAPNRTLTIAWLDVAYYGLADTVSFEVTLHEGTGDIVFQYLDVGAGSHAYGASATVGIEDASGQQGLQVSYNQAGLGDGMAIRIYDTSVESDADGDGIPDSADNCLEVPNAGQLDSDEDGYGNVCDADYDQSGSTGIVDFNTFRVAFDSQLGDVRYRAECDHNGDGTISTVDFNVMRNLIDQPPGPSGLACAGTAGCRAD